MSQLDLVKVTTCLAVFLIRLPRLLALKPAKA